MSDDLNQKVQQAWDRAAEWWDERVGPEGNDFQRVLIGPSTERLLELKFGDLVLDVACGNGQFARRMADLGARVVAVDFSEKFLERARAHSTRTRAVSNSASSTRRVAGSCWRWGNIGSTPRSVRWLSWTWPVTNRWHRFCPHS